MLSRHQLSEFDKNSRTSRNSIEDAKTLLESAAKIVKGITDKKSNATDKLAPPGRNVNHYRTQYNSFLRSVWRQLPNIDQYDSSSFSAYCCRDKTYEEVVDEVATVIHKYLFFGLEKLSFPEIDDHHVEVEFPLVSCKLQQQH